jgi:hypothetical protein
MQALKYRSVRKTDLDRSRSSLPLPLKADHIGIGYEFGKLYPVDKGRIQGRQIVYGHPTGNRTRPSDIYGDFALLLHFKVALTRTCYCFCRPSFDVIMGGRGRAP